MKTLVIHPLDESTDFLCDVYKGKGWLTIRNEISEKTLRKLIKKHDRIVMLGHGSPYGLLDFEYGRTRQIGYVIDYRYVDLLRDKTCVCVWCMSDVFMEEHRLKGFYTGMFISEISEARMFDIDPFEGEIESSNWVFANSVRTHIDDRNMHSKVLNDYQLDGGKIRDYNRPHIYHSDNRIETVKPDYGWMGIPPHVQAMQL